MNQNNDDAHPWYDYQPSQGRIPDNVKFLRIGFLQYQQLLQGNRATAPFDIEDKAFQYHPNLKQVQIYLPAVSRISLWAFRSCQHLEKVEFVMKPKTVGEDADNALPSQLVSIDRSSFSRCQKLRSVVGLEQAAESLQSICSSAFGECCALDNVNFQSSLTHLLSLGAWAFLGCTSLTTVDLSKAVGLAELLSQTFAYCRALAIVHLPPNLVRIENKAFLHCNSLEQIILPQSVQIIGNSAFYGCKKLTTIALPASLQIVGTYCFAACEMLSCVVLSSSKLPFLKLHPFNESCHSLSSLDLPTPVPHRQWPLILEQFTRVDGIPRVNGQISNTKNRNTIIWNFLCQNMAQMFMEDTTAMSRRRPAHEI